MKLSIRAITRPAGLAAFAAAAALAAAANAQEAVTVAYLLKWPTANQVAQVEKIYDQEMGVDVEWRSFANGNEISQAMASGDVDIAYAQGLVPFIVAVSNGVPIEMVGIAMSYARADNCIVRDDAGITQENAKDLEGKRVATPIGNVTHYKLLRMLDHLGVDASQVQMVEMDGPDAAVALARGDVVMGCAFGGPLQRMEAFGAPLMTAEEQKAIGIRAFDVVSTTASFAKQHPDLLRKFLEVTDRYNELYAEDPEAYQETIASAAGMDLKSATEMLGMLTFPSNEAQASEEWLAGSVPTFMKEVADFFVDQGQLDGALDSYESTINTSFLKN